MQYVVMIILCLFTSNWDLNVLKVLISLFSAGIGRTGTYIAIDVLSETGKTHKKINIAEYVKKMRRNRMNMVQTYVIIVMNLNAFSTTINMIIIKINMEVFACLNVKNKTILLCFFLILIRKKMHWTNTLIWKKYKCDLFSLVKVLSYFHSVLIPL